jgi:hypothetical protein
MVGQEHARAAFRAMPLLAFQLPFFGNCEKVLLASLRMLRLAALICFLVSHLVHSHFAFGAGLAFLVVAALTFFSARLFLTSKWNLSLFIRDSCES